MRLKSIEISGFKSFADPVRIDFRPGISSIVGPNGCGKSNIADAIRWVLGTQSPRQLRAERMESVIFSGSSGRKQLGMAEVTLVFDNSDRAMGLDFDEVSVSRRLFRSGDSEYSINGARCRLMDITDLVVDRGLGSTGYWILEAKMVNTILSSRPEDRRSLFDEAAGIVKYKIQRHRAELKLDSTGSDLERLADIINEVDSSCRILGRQVSACKRHEKLTGEIEEAKRAKAEIEAHSLGGELDSSRKRLEDAGAEVGKETALLATAGASLAGKRMEFTSVQARLDDAHRECAGIDSKIAACERDEAVTREKIASLKTRIDENTARMARERERIHEYSDSIQKTQAEQETATEAISRSEQEHTQACRIRDEAALELSQRKEALGKTAEELSRLDSSLRELADRRTEEVRLREAMSQKISYLQSSMEELSSRTRQLEARKASTLDRLVILRKERYGIESELEDIRHGLFSLESGLAEKSESFALLDRETAVMADGVERLTRLADGLAEEGGISAVLKPLPGMGKALGAFLYGFGKASAVHSVDDRSRGEGSLYACGESREAPPVPPGCTPLSECVEEGCDDLTASILARGVLASGRESAQSLIAEGYPCTVVTIAGDIFRPEGFVRLGVAEEEASSLELTGLLEERCMELAANTGLLKTAAEELEKLRLDVKKLRDSLAAAQGRLGALEKNAAAAESMIESVDGDSAVLVERQKALRKELQHLEAAGNDTKEHDACRETRRLEGEREAAISRLDENSTRVANAEKTALETAGRVEELSFDLRTRRSALAEMEKRTDFLRRELDRMEESLDSSDRENSGARSSIEEYAKKLKELGSELEILKTRRGEAEKTRGELTASRNSLMEETALQERDVHQIRERLGRSRSLMIELEGKVSSLEERLNRLACGADGVENTFRGLSSEEIDSEIETRFSALERLGPVNMLAVSEFQQTKARLDYLSSQRNDLQEARESLACAISEINEEAAKRFNETFAKVRDNFREMFGKLFEGGEGDIVSLPGEDPLEGGIEIMARPGGKKLKSVIALSDGERAMTAVVLLFSLYLVKPSPFCVLDELDSPFDDTNTDKFVSILRDFCHSTQFIVITHNKRTMEGSDVLYGVTMAEEGVSNMTSVSLEEMVSGS